MNYVARTGDRAAACGKLVVLGIEYFFKRSTNAAGLLLQSLHWAWLLSNLTRGTLIGSIGPPAYERVPIFSY